MRESQITAQSHVGQAERLAAAPVCVLFRGERRLWCEMSGAERDAYAVECRRLRAEAEGHA